MQRTTVSCTTETFVQPCEAAHLRQASLHGSYERADFNSATNHVWRTYHGVTAICRAQRYVPPLGWPCPAPLPAAGLLTRRGLVLRLVQWTQSVWYRHSSLKGFIKGSWVFSFISASRSCNKTPFRLHTSAEYSCLQWYQFHDACS